MKFPVFIIALFFTAVLSSVSTHAQKDKPRESPKDSVSQAIGSTDVKIVYGSPSVKGRKIWGELVPYGMNTGNKYSNDKPYPWRGGANENTTIEFSSDVMVEGSALPKGKYGVHFIPSETTWVVIFSKNSSSWGSYKYNQDEDALRVTVTPVKAPFQERLKYGFDDVTDNSATAYLQWELLKVPFKITVK
ncbi:MAG TPA: DUF2911 domain-containing protein [Ignavibacteriales bacterium]|nr:DUF2911 domain-containing protein [Ignavibacteriales bacterium]